MATYKEQIEKRRQSKVSKAMIAFAELGQIGDALAILEREGCMMPYERIAFIRLYVQKHLEINEAIKEHAAQSATVRALKEDSHEQG